MKKIAVYNQKGGCAKTTSVINIAGIMARDGKKVLVVDCDPQANATKTLLMEMESEYSTIVNVLEQNEDINQAIVPALIRTRENAKAKYRGIDVLAAERGMSAIDLQSEYMLKDKLDGIKKKYDYIIFDCPPYISDFTINILAAADTVLVPATCDKDSLDGYGELLDTINTLKRESVNSRLSILGVFLTIMNTRDSFDQYIFDSSKESLGDVFIPVSIRRSTYAKQASLFGRPLCWFKRMAKVTRDYERLVDEIEKRLEER